VKVSDAAFKVSADACGFSIFDFMELLRGPVLFFTNLKFHSKETRKPAFEQDVRLGTTLPKLGAFEPAFKEYNSRIL